MITHCFVWHEGEAAKGSSEIGTSLQKFAKWVHSQKVNTLNFFSDCCGGQNSNWMVIIALHEAFLEFGFERFGISFSSF